jgi:predicted dinucleotide-binding enzyme
MYWRPAIAVLEGSGGSAALEAKAILGAGVKVVSAFHNVAAAKLHAGGKVDCDVLVFGDDKVKPTMFHRLAWTAAPGTACKEAGRR